MAVKNNGRGDAGEREEALRGGKAWGKSVERLGAKCGNAWGKSVSNMESFLVSLITLSHRFQRPNCPIPTILLPN